MHALTRANSHLLPVPPSQGIKPNVLFTGLLKTFGWSTEKFVSCAKNPSLTLDSAKLG